MNNNLRDPKKLAARGSSYTLLIPTYNRTKFLKRLLRFFAGANVDFPILVLDSSAEDIVADNRSVCDSSGLNITHRQYSSELKGLEKLTDGLGKVSTPYASFCGDDDIIFPESITACVEFLMQHPDYIACHGQYISFSETDSSHLGVEYCGKSLSGETALKRIWQLMSNYEATFYAIFQTDVLRSTYESMPKFSHMFGELYVGIHPLIAGKMERLNQVHYARNVGSGFADKARSRWHPQEYISESPGEMFSEYLRYKTLLLDSIQKKEPAHNFVQLERQFDLIHTVYFMYTAELNHFVNLLNGELCPVSEVYPDALSRWQSINGRKDEIVSPSALSELERYRKLMEASLHEPKTPAQLHAELNYWNEILAAQPGLIAGYIELGKILAALGRTDEGVACLRKAKEMLESQLKV